MTSVKFAAKKQIVLLSENDSMMEAVENCHFGASANLVSQEYCHISLPCLDSRLRRNDNVSTSIFSLPKIDLLIADSVDILLPYYKIKTIINIGGENSLSPDEIRFTKPFRLNKLLKLVERTVNRPDIFCAINNDLIYNEVSCTLNTSEKSIKFTEKENEIFKFILLSTDFSITKEMLMKSIWQYHEDTESLTLDTHLYKLKTKLPKGMLEVKNNICRLDITSII